MSLLADLLSTLFERRYAGFGKREVDERPIEQLCHDLLSSKGQVTGAGLADLILQRYATLSDEEKHAFFTFLNVEMDIDAGAIEDALSAYKADGSQGNYRSLMNLVEPKRQELARRLNQVPGATEQLVAMRDDLLRLARDDPAIAKADVDFRHLFASWFNRGFLVLRPINWESPANILEKIIAYEAVHAIDSWEDLRRRLEPMDRRCFGFFHPAMPDEPLIFVEVALTKGIPSSVQALLAEDRVAQSPEDADTAVFYSISNCQSGLAGISFGNSLIKQVVSDLSSGLPNLETFVTLSPIPRLTEWARREGIEIEVDKPERVRQIAACYLCNAKHANGTPFDPVARFHLTNGALIHDVHADADTSANGRAQSAGAMVNYLYELQKIEGNHEAYAGAQTVVTSAAVRQLTRQAALASDDENGKGTG